MEHIFYKKFQNCVDRAYLTSFIYVNRCQNISLHLFSHFNHFNRSDGYLREKRKV